ncbi:MAG: hypothetical protein FWF01_00675 [Alphaproteobacteria bacterium]|nr:hypothetical protein [Alphaproteobacteria bacterium]
MKHQISTLEETQKLIAAERILLIAGDEAVLAKLPKGRWVGGSTPYFMTPGKGGMVSRDSLFVSDITDAVATASIKKYTADSLPQVYKDCPDNGFSYIIIPALSSAHMAFALNAPNYESFGFNPLIGWIAAVHLDDLDKVKPKVFNGETGEAIEDGAIVLHAALPPGKVAEIGIINPFQQGPGDTLTFEQDGFSAADVLVNGQKQNFAEYMMKVASERDDSNEALVEGQKRNLDEYMKEKNLVTKLQLPLVADYYGALVNISFFNRIDKDKGVQFYAPVFKGVKYKLAAPLPDYVGAFAKLLDAEKVQEENILFSCNCVLNYLYSNLENKKTASFVGPVAFGEIAYQLVNQTLTYLQIK